MIVHITLTLPQWLTMLAQLTPALIVTAAAWLLNDTIAQIQGAEQDRRERMAAAGYREVTDGHNV